MIPVELLRQVRRIQIRVRRAVNSFLGGEYHSAFKGSGLSFEDVREYQPGDDVRRIDWNVTARTGKPFIKRFVEERELTILLAVDFSASLLFGSTDTTKRTVAAELAALIAFAAIANGDRVGLIGFTDRIERYVPPRRGGRQAIRLLRDVLFYKPEHFGTDLNEGLNELVRVQRRRAIVFLISDFPDSGYASSFRRTASRHDLIAVRVHDPLERAWPDDGMVRIADAETGQVMVMSAARLKDMKQELIESLARKTGADLIDVCTTGGHVDALLAFLRKRERRRQQ